MPIYQLKCDKCETEYETFCFLSERDKVKCPSCGSIKKKVVYQPTQDVWHTDGNYKNSIKKETK
jgi:putative FmdB family regulatory protein